VPDEKPRTREFGLSLAVTGVGLEMVVPIIAGIILDQQMGWSPWATLIGAGLGLAVSLMHIFWIHKQSVKPPRDPQEPK
jgi:hypothetical protein